MALQFLLWIKILAFCKLTHRWGKITKTIELMIYDLMKFLILFGIIIVGFATFMH